ncbi:MAG: phosphomannomutase/phosphoglucomutase [Candidatus Parcubacteria bacterium]
MSINPKLFKAYDIRGLAPQEIDEDFAYRVGQAVVRFTKAKTVVVGKDMRGTTPSLFAALAKGVMSQGADVIDVGMVTTPMFYYAVADYELHDAGVMVTASHNPSQYNGFKMVFGDAMPIGGETGMNDIRDLALAGPYEGTKEGTIVETSIQEAYVEKLLSLVDTKALRPLKVVVDTANGMEGIVIGDVLDRIKKVSWEGLFLDLDGNFPNHEANPLKEETLEALKERIRATGADLGVAFDGDADRMGLVDETGEPVRGDLILALLAPVVMEKGPGATVLYTVNCSMVAAEEIERAGGRAVMTRVGHGLIKPHMRREKAIFAGELSSHFFFRDLANAECPDMAMLMVFELMTKTGKKLSELVAPLRRYHHSGEINSAVGDKDAVLAALEKAYAPRASSVSKIDGIRMDFRDPAHPEDDWWWSVRASNTEPLLRLNLEAKKKDRMEKERDWLLKVIRA